MSTIEIRTKVPTNIFMHYPGQVGTFSIDSIVGTGLGFSGFSGLRVLEFFVRVSGRASGLIY